MTAPSLIAPGHVLITTSIHPRTAPQVVPQGPMLRGFWRPKHPEKAPLTQSCPTSGPQVRDAARWWENSRAEHLLCRNPTQAPPLIIAVQPSEAAQSLGQIQSMTQCATPPFNARLTSPTNVPPQGVGTRLPYPVKNEPDGGACALSRADAVLLLRRATCIPRTTAVLRFPNDTPTIRPGHRKRGGGRHLVQCFEMT